MNILPPKLNRTKPNIRNKFATKKYRATHNLFPIKFMENGVLVLFVLRFVLITNNEHRLNIRTHFNIYLK